MCTSWRLVPLDQGLINLVKAFVQKQNIWMLQNIVCTQVILTDSCLVSPPQVKTGCYVALQSPEPEGTGLALHCKMQCVVEEDLSNYQYSQVLILHNWSGGNKKLPFQRARRKLRAHFPCRMVGPQRSSNYSGAVFRLSTSRQWRMSGQNSCQLSFKCLSFFFFFIVLQAQLVNCDFTKPRSWIIFKWIFLKDHLFIGSGRFFEIFLFDMLELFPDFGLQEE